MIVPTHPNLPHLARWLVAHFTPRVDREFLVTDLDDEFESYVAEFGIAPARAWYWKQCITSALPLLRHRIASRSAVDHSRPAPSRRRSPRMFTSFSSDLRDAWRRTRRAPFVSATIVLIFALGIGATTAVYSVVRGVLLKPLNFAGSERVVRIETQYPKFPTDLPSDSWMDYTQWKSLNTSFEQLAGIWEGGTARVFKVAGETTTEPVAIVTLHADQVLGLRTLKGRLFRDEEFSEGSAPVVLLGERYWQRAFGGDSSIVGRMIDVSDTSRLVIGVLADAATDYPGPQMAAWMPMIPRAGTSFASARTKYLALIARLKRGVTPAQANAEMQRLIARTSEKEIDKTRTSQVILLQDKLTAPARPVLWLLTAVVSVVLMVAAGNVTLLLLAQAHARRRELAIRASLGSAFTRLVRKLMVESMLMAFMGGIAGVLTARGLIALMLKFYPGRLARAHDIVLDVPVLTVALLTTVVVALLGAVPLVRSIARLDLIRDLREGAGTLSRRGMQSRQLLAVFQLAFATCLVAGGGLLVRTFMHLTQIEPGFRAERVGYVSVSGSPVRYPTAAELLQHLDAVEDAVRHVPGIVSAASVNYLPLPSRIVGWGTQMTRANDNTNTEFPIQFRQMSERYLDVMSISLRRGRTLTAADNASSPPVAIINETLAKKAFPGVDPIGQSIVVQHTTWQVVGVVGDMLYWGLAKPVVGEVYVTPAQAFKPDAPTAFAFRSIVFKSAGDPLATISAVRAAIHRVDPSISMGVPGTLTERLNSAMAPERFRALLVGALGVIALMLAALGLYAVTAFGVMSRTREIGIRVALGATSRGVGGAVMLDALRVGIIGTALGLGLAWYGVQGIERFLVGATRLDSGSVVFVAVLLPTVTLVAALIPALRASRVDPLTAMRAE